MIAWLLLVVALALVGLNSWRGARAHQEAMKRERKVSAMLERMLEERIEAEEQAVAKAWCCGWDERAAFEECVRRERQEVVEQRLRGLTN